MNLTLTLKTATLKQTNMAGRISEFKHFVADAEGQKNILKGKMLEMMESEARKRPFGGPPLLSSARRWMLYKSSLTAENLPHRKDEGRRSWRLQSQSMFTRLSLQEQICRILFSSYLSALRNIKRHHL